MRDQDSIDDTVASELDTLAMAVDSGVEIVLWPLSRFRGDMICNRPFGQFISWIAAWTIDAILKPTEYLVCARRGTYIYPATEIMLLQEVRQTQSNQCAYVVKTLPGAKWTRT